MFFKKSFVLLLFFALIVAGCSKETSINPEEQSKIQSEIKFLIDKGFGNSGNIQYSPGTSEYAESYVTDGDMMIRREDVQKMIKDSDLQSNNKIHRKHQYMASAGNKTVRVISGVPTLWNTAVSDAISAWNSLGLTIVMGGQSATTTSTALYVVNVRYVAIPSEPNTVARALVPVSNGVMGNELQINSSYTGSLTANQRKLVIAHELGHVLGFKHTDTNEGLIVNNTGIVASCRQNADPSSIMRIGTSPVASWNGFSYCDGQVFNFIYWLS